MKLRRHLTYANVASTLALVGVIGAGGAYAGGLIGSGDIRDNSIQSRDLRNGLAVRGADVKANSLTGKRINESTLNARGFAPVKGRQELDCDPMSAAFIDCAGLTIQLRQRSQLLVIATGANYSEAATGANGTCRISVNGDAEDLGQVPGEEATDNTSSNASDGFARTAVTESLASGSVRAALVCNQVGAEDFQVDRPTIAAIAIGQG